VIDEPTGSGLGAGLGVQVTLALGGTTVTLQLALGAGLGPLLVQVTVPLAVVPAAGVAGKPLAVACMSASGATLRGSVSTLLLITGSAVEVPAVVVMFKLPPAPRLAGAGKVLVQVMLPPTGNGLGAGAGVQLCVAPVGKPLKAQVGAAAGLGPALVQVPLTVTGWPAVAVGGTVVEARMSACGTTVWLVLATLLGAIGSAVLVPAVPVTVTVPVAGTV
jgi:hypothetical protein